MVPDKRLSDTGTFVRRHGTMRPFGLRAEVVVMLAEGTKDNRAAKELGCEGVKEPAETQMNEERKESSAEPQKRGV